jgi:hypothetical protein
VPSPPPHSMGMMAHHLPLGSVPRHKGCRHGTTTSSMSIA